MFSNGKNVNILRKDLFTHRAIKIRYCPDLLKISQSNIFPELHHRDLKSAKVKYEQLYEKHKMYGKQD